MQKNRAPPLDSAIAKMIYQYIIYCKYLIKY